MNEEFHNQDPDLAMKSLMRLDSWIERNGWAGHDPYDIKGTKLFPKVQKELY